MACHTSCRACHQTWCVHWNLPMAVLSDAGRKPMTGPACMMTRARPRKNTHCTNKPAPVLQLCEGYQAGCMPKGIVKGDLAFCKRSDLLNTKTRGPRPGPWLQKHGGAPRFSGLEKGSQQDTKEHLGRKGGGSQKEPAMNPQVALSVSPLMWLTSGSSHCLQPSCQY